MRILVLLFALVLFGCGAGESEKTEKAKEEVQEVMTELRRLGKISQVIGGPLKEFTKRIADDDELHRLWKKMLQSEIAPVLVAGRIEYASANIEDAIQQLLGEFVVEGEDGGLQVSVEDEQADR